MSNRFKNRGTVVFAIALAVLLSLGLFGLANGDNDKNESPTCKTGESFVDGQCQADTVDDKVQQDLAPCSTTWKMKSSTPKNGDWVTEVPSIKTAKTKAEARAAANDWVELVKEHPETLRGAAAFILNKNVKAKALVDDEGCASDKADALATEIKVALAASTISAGQAPTDGRNSGADPKTGEVYAYNFVGVSGDRKAIKIVLPGGRVVWVMARCGNPVIKTPPPVKEGCKKGCNPPPPPKCPPGTTTYEGRCVKKASDDGVGGNNSHANQPVQESKKGNTPGADKNNPPPKDNDPVRTPDGNGQSENGSPGNGGVKDDGPKDNTHQNDQTGSDPAKPGNENPDPPCPFGEGNC